MATVAGAMKRYCPTVKAAAAAKAPSPLRDFLSFASSIRQPQKRQQAKAERRFVKRPFEREHQSYPDQQLAPDQAKSGQVDLPQPPTSIGRSRLRIAASQRFFLSCGTDWDEQNISIFLMSHQDIADHLGLKIETVSRAIADLERSKMLTRISSKRLLVRNRLALGHMLN